MILNRTAKGDLDQDQRLLNLKQTKPDLCIAIHHDANVSSKPNGFGSLYSLPYSYEPAKYIYKATMDAGIYNSKATANRNRLEWHYYFVARMSDCPVVLTENGFMRNPSDHRGIVSDLTNWKKAKAITKGVAQYFLSIRIEGYTPPAITTTTTVTTSSKSATASDVTTTRKSVITPSSVTVSTTATTSTTTTASETEESTLETEESTLETEESTIETEESTLETEESTLGTEDTSPSESESSTEPSAEPEPSEPSEPVAEE